MTTERRRAVGKRRRVQGCWWTIAERACPHYWKPHCKYRRFIISKHNLFFPATNKFIFSDSQTLAGTNLKGSSIYNSNFLSMFLFLCL